METRTWSSDQLASEFSGCENLAEVIASIEQIFWREGHVLCHIFVNGMRFSEKDEAKFATTHLKEIQDLKIVAQKTEEVVRESIKSGYDLLRPLQTQTLMLSEHFRLGQNQEAQRVLAQLVDGCQWLTQVIYFVIPQLSALNVDAGTIGQWTGRHQEFTRIVKEMLVSFEAKDFLLLSDVLEYELTTEFDKCFELFASTIKIVED